MKIYVAGRTTDTRTVSGIAESLEEEGHEITFKWFDPAIGEIRVGSLEREDLEVLARPSAPSAIEENQGDWKVTLRHKPTGKEATGTGHSRLAATDVAANLLRAQLNSGWSENPDRASRLAQIELAAVGAADAVVLVWAPDLLGAALETGAAIYRAFLGEDVRVYIYRPGRDSVFWYRPNVKVVWSKAEILDDLTETA